MIYGLIDRAIALTLLTALAEIKATGLSPYGEGLCLHAETVLHAEPHKTVVAVRNLLQRVMLTWPDSDATHRNYPVPNVGDANYNSVMVSIMFSYKMRTAPKQINAYLLKRWELLLHCIDVLEEELQ